MSSFDPVFVLATIKDIMPVKEQATFEKNWVDGVSFLCFG
jgi:hypothetical protein